MSRPFVILFGRVGHSLFTIGHSLFCSQTAFYPESLDPNRSAEGVYLSIVRSMAKMPTFAAWAYKNAVGHPVNYPDNKQDYCARFLKMMFALPAEDYEVDPIVASALDKLLILHADHEQNCSTSTVRIVGSSKASIYSSISAGINALASALDFTGARNKVATRSGRESPDGRKYTDCVAKPGRWTR